MAGMWVASTLVESYDVQSCKSYRVVTNFEVRGCQKTLITLILHVFFVGYGL